MNVHVLFSFVTCIKNKKNVDATLNAKTNERKIRKSRVRANIGMLILFSLLTIPRRFLNLC